MEDKEWDELKNIQEKYFFQTSDMYKINLKYKTLSASLISLFHMPAKPQNKKLNKLNMINRYRILKIS